jgi:hypothetical protein
VFEAIRTDPAVFCSMTVTGGVISWPNGADIDPDVLYYGLRQHAGIGLPAPRCRPLDDAVGLGSGGYFVSCVLPKARLDGCGSYAHRHAAVRILRV